MGGRVRLESAAAACAGPIRRLSGRFPALPLMVALALFALPLFAGLDRWDLESDEALYSYSVARILETGEWLTPRGIFQDGPFLEKPPLKTWIVAAGISLGLPPSEVGLRFFDALFSLAAFAYVFLIGRRLAGPICAFIAVLVLHTSWPLIFAHGLRTNNMEAALLLTYSGGVYHFLRWVEAPDRRAGRLQAWLVASFFAFGFMSKFVAALFLPAILGAGLMWRRDTRALLRTRWAEWLAPAAGATAMVAPWFIYESVRYGRSFWNIILGLHVLRRFTTFLDPTHLKPWYFYFTQTFSTGFRPAFPLLLSLAGLALLAVRAVRNRSWLARLVLVWWILPYVALSAGTSKLFHYAYPFFPPIALAAGLAASWVFEVARGWIQRPAPSDAARPAPLGRSTWRLLLVGLAGLSLALGVWSIAVGPVAVSGFGLRLFRSSGILRPALVAAALLALASERRAALWVLLSAAILTAAHAPEYPLIRRQLLSVNRPLGAIRDCVAGHPNLRRGVYVPDPSRIPHPYFYYFRSLGPWVEGPANREQELALRLFATGRQTLVVTKEGDLVVEATGPGASELIGIRTFPEVVVWLPGPYAACYGAAIAAGGGAEPRHAPGS
jgi:Dolichyl-phosphate-mannose-protein mannosyltransferase